VFNFFLPVLSILQHQYITVCVLVRENVFRVLQKRVQEICKWCLNA